MSAEFIHVIARALIRVERHVLLARCNGAANTFLPGGHVECSESVHDAIHRELQEEFGSACRVGEYVGAIEHSFTDRGVTQHEINHIFDVELRSVAPLAPLQSLEAHLEFFWHPIAKIQGINLKPEPLVGFLQANARRPLWASTVANR